MITEHDLQEAIAECEGQRNPTANTCLKLAAFYTIRDKMYPAKQEEGKVTMNMPMYSYARSEEQIDAVRSEFLQVISGLSPEDFLPIMDELMESVRVVIPKLYNAVMDKLTEI